MYKNHLYVQQMYIFIAQGDGHLLVYLVVWCNYYYIFLKTYLLATPVFSTMWFVA